ncbi:MAG: hypothetical protein KGS72_08815 [Cyanobacteria bacterium REEB67]|nr:hypothetical protein [Cyanobacteria bacterium REEB67]
MNVKTIAIRSMVAVALAVTSVAPALANNNQALNAMAMQMYAQNQALGAHAYGYNPALSGGYGYNANPYAAAAAVYGNGPTPWSAGALPAGSYATNYGYNNLYNTGIYNRNLGCFHRYWHR